MNNFFLKKLDISPFCGATDTLFCTSGDVSSGFQSQSAYSHLMYVLQLTNLFLVTNMIRSNKTFKFLPFLPKCFFKEWLNIPGYKIQTVLWFLRLVHTVRFFLSATAFFNQKAKRPWKHRSQRGTNKRFYWSHQKSQNYWSSCRMR